MWRQTTFRAPRAAPIHDSAAIAAAPGVQRVTATAPATPGSSLASFDIATPTASGGGRSERSRPRLSIDVPLHLAPLERQRARVRRPEQFAVHARQQSPEP